MSTIELLRQKLSPNLLDSLTFGGLQTGLVPHDSLIAQEVEAPNDCVSSINDDPFFVRMLLN